MKIYAARDHRNYKLDYYVGKDLWIMMRAPNMHVFYVKLCSQISDEEFLAAYIPCTSVLRADSSAKWFLTAPPTQEKISWDSEYWSDYNFLVEHPLDVMTTQEILDTIEAKL